MKMRIQGNVIRFRLNRREVSEVATVGRVSAAVVFPGARNLGYALVKGGSQVDALFDGSEIQIRVPASIIDEWAGTDRVGIQQRVSVDGSTDLELIVEKDFQCMHKGEAGKDPEAYPNPMATESA